MYLITPTTFPCNSNTRSYFIQDHAKTNQNCFICSKPLAKFFYKILNVHIAFHGSK